MLRVDIVQVSDIPHLLHIERFPRLVPKTYKRNQLYLRVNMVMSGTTMNTYKADNQFAIGSVFNCWRDNREFPDNFANQLHIEGQVNQCYRRLPSFFFITFPRGRLLRNLIFHVKENITIKTTVSKRNFCKTLKRLVYINDFRDSCNFLKLLQTQIGVSEKSVL